MPPKRATENVRPAGLEPQRAGREPAEKNSFYADMANGLHALAQPLTVLRIAMAAATLPGATAEHQRLYLDISAGQVDRACTLFQCLQQLVAAREVEADRGSIDVAGMVAPVVEAERAVLAAMNIAIEAAIPDSLPLVMGDMDRTLEALFAALKIAGSVSSPGDAIAISVKAAKDVVALTVENRRSHEKRLTSADRLALSLAESNIRSQRGTFEVVENPFRVSFTLPLLDCEENDVSCADVQALLCQ